MSEHELQGELKQPGIVELVGDHPKLRVAERRSREIELNAIEQIVKLRTELKRDPLFGSEGRVFENRQIDVIYTGPANIGERS